MCIDPLYYRYLIRPKMSDILPKLLETCLNLFIYAFLSLSSSLSLSLHKNYWSYLYDNKYQNTLYYVYISNNVIFCRQLSQIMQKTISGIAFRKRTHVKVPGGVLFLVNRSYPLHILFDMSCWHSVFSSQSVDLTR